VYLERFIANYFNPANIIEICFKLTMIISFHIFPSSLSLLRISYFTVYKQSWVAQLVQWLGFRLDDSVIVFRFPAGQASTSELGATRLLFIVFWCCFPGAKESVTYC